jgi:hypothetical protein
MIHNGENYSLGNIGKAVVSDGDVFTNCNLEQAIPTYIFVGKTNLQHYNCKDLNCIWSDGSRGMQMSRCSNLHPELVAEGLTPCVVNCTHVVDSDTLTVDGVLVQTNYSYADKEIV